MFIHAKMYNKNTYILLNVAHIVSVQPITKDGNEIGCEVQTTGKLHNYWNLDCSFEQFVYALAQGNPRFSRLEALAEFKEDWE